MNSYAWQENLGKPEQQQQQAAQCDTRSLRSGPADLDQNLAIRTHRIVAESQDPEHQPRREQREHMRASRASAGLGVWGVTCAARAS